MFNVRLDLLQPLRASAMRGLAFGGAERAVLAVHRVTDRKPVRTKRGTGIRSQRSDASALYHCRWPLRPVELNQLFPAGLSRRINPMPGDKLLDIELTQCGMINNHLLSNYLSRLRLSVY